MRALRLLAGLSVLVALLMCMAPSARAGNGAETTTGTANKGETQSFDDILPCAGNELYHFEFTIINGVFHITELPDGTFHLTDTATATFVATPIGDLSLPTYTGRIHQLAEKLNLGRNKPAPSGTSVTTLHAEGSDGSRVRFHITVHFNVSATGIERTVVNVRCG